MKNKEQNKEWEQAMEIFKKNPAKGAEIIVSLLRSKDDRVRLEAAIFILDRVCPKNST